MLDTLKYYQQLRSAGVEEPQAQAMTEGLAEAIRGSVATKADFMELRTEFAGLDRRVAGLEGQVAGLDARVAGLDARVARLDARVAGLDGRVIGLDRQFVTLRQLLLGLYAYATVALALMAISAHVR